MNTTAVKSSAIKSVSHDGRKDRLTVNFKNGRSYLYVNVPVGIAVNLVYAPSVGEYFNTNIRNKYKQVQL